MLEHRPQLIGLTGAARSGKDTVAEYLFTHWGYARHSMAKPLKDGLAAMLGLDGRHLDGLLKEQPVEPYGVSPRRMLQTLGTEWGRDLIHPDIWLLRAQEVFAQTPLLVVPDVRFANEAAWIREHGTLVHVLRPHPEKIEAHVSEDGIPMDLHDHWLQNDGSLLTLYARCDGMMERMLQHKGARQDTA